MIEKIANSPWIVIIAVTVLMAQILPAMLE
jgi:hypothetical protein